jgi:WD40 repeat protein
LGATSSSDNGNMSTSVTTRQFKLVSTAADKCVRFIPLDDDSTHEEDAKLAFDFIADSSVLSYAVISSRYILFLTISGNLGVYDAVSQRIASTQRYHGKFGIRISTVQTKSGVLVATAGWDRKVQLVYLHTAGDSSSDDSNKVFSGELPEPTATLTLESLPEDILFKRNPHTGQLYLIASRRDSTFLYYYAIDETHIDKDCVKLAGRQNLAPYANSWNTFSPSSMSPCPTDEGMIAVATSSVPHMKVLLVRLLYPSMLANEDVLATIPSDVASDVTGKESMAILVHCNTMVSQTQYSIPLVTWRPDGTGVWVNSDEGTVKGIDLSGKIVATLRGHDPGSRIRCLHAGLLTSGGKTREILISGGFDQKVITWESDAA